MAYSFILPVLLLMKWNFFIFFLSFILVRTDDIVRRSKHQLPWGSPMGLLGVHSLSIYPSVHNQLSERF